MLLRRKSLSSFLGFDLANSLETNKQSALYTKTEIKLHKILTLICSRVVVFEICNWQSKLLTFAISEIFSKEARSTATEIKDMTNIVRNQNKTFFYRPFEISVHCLCFVSEWEVRFKQHCEPRK